MFYKLKPFTSAETFSISYKEPLKVPVQIEISKDTIYMTVHVEFDPVFLEPIDRTDTKDALLKSKPEGYSYADAFVEGIRAQWAKSYVFEGSKKPVYVKMNVIRKDDPEASYDPKQRFFKVRQVLQVLLIEKPITLGQLLVSMVQHNHQRQENERCQGYDPHDLRHALALHLLLVNLLVGLLQVKYQWCLGQIKQLRQSRQRINRLIVFDLTLVGLYKISLL